MFIFPSVFKTLSLAYTYPPSSLVYFLHLPTFFPNHLIWILSYTSSFHYHLFLSSFLCPEDISNTFLTVSFSTEAALSMSSGISSLDTRDELSVKSYPMTVTGTALALKSQRLLHASSGIPAELLTQSAGKDSPLPRRKLMNTLAK